MVGYAAYTERFADDLRGVQRAPALPRGARGALPAPHAPAAAREGDNDGGYAVADYRQVRPDLGTMDDLAALADALHERGMSLVLDLVLNHVAREHEWARRAREGTLRTASYFHVFADRRLPDAYERTLPEVFPDFAPGNFTWDEDLRGWVWTTFNAWQWDVNWGNPDVLVEYAEIILDLANRGVDVLRLDAIAFIWKRLGTDCQGQPEVHALTQVLRAVTRIACPAVAFKAEAIVAPTKLLAYLGQGEHTGKVSDLAYHNSLMVQVWSMLAARDVRLAAHALGSLPRKPPSATWLTYLRCHDDIGWAIMDEDAAAVGVTGPGHRHFLADWYSGDFWGSPARGLVFQFNPDDRRPAHLRARRPRSSGWRPPRPRRRSTRRSRPCGSPTPSSSGWGGIPVIWSGDELGQPNDPRLGARSRGTRATTAGPTGPGSTASGSRARHDPTTVARAGVRRPRRARAGPGRPAAPARVGRVRRRPRRRPRGARRPARPPRSAGSRASTTSRRSRGCGPGGGCTSSGWPTRSTPSPAPPLPWGADGDVHLPPYAALWLTTP